MATPTTEPDRPIDCIVVGGGLAGLACAHGLAAAGRRVHLLEAGDAVGGRARTTWHEGRPVDLGFQALFGAYPETRRFLREIGLRRRDLRAFDRGAVVHDGRSWARFSVGPRGLLRFPALTAADAGRLALLAAEAAARSPEALLAEEGLEPTTEAYLRARGFSDGAIEGLLRPLFGAMLLDRGLGADPGWFRFLLAMLARGPAVLPSDGIGMVAEWAAGATRAAGGTVETGARVRAIEPDPAGRRAAAVRLADGRRLEARFVVLAVDAPSARPLLSPVDQASAARLPTEAASAMTAAFALDRPLYRGRTPILNAAPADERGPRVDLVCQTSNLTRPDAGPPHILLATSITTGGAADPERVVDAVGDLVTRWSPRFPWGRARPLAVTEHRFAQFRPLAGVRHDLPGPRTALENLILAGDLTRHPSIEGAVASGRSAAAIVDALAT